MKDPGSRRVEWGRSGKAWSWMGLFGGGNRFGYRIKALISPETNSDGFVEAEHYFFFFRNGVFEIDGVDAGAGTHGFVP